jgi:SP family general alpha glucoside:H+ symporter-like MFS transporter
LQPDGTFAVDANWISNIGNCGNVGTAIGLCITGYCQERFGSKKTYIAGMVACTAFIFMLVFAHSLPMLLAAELLFNIPMGMFQVR